MAAIKPFIRLLRLPQWSKSIFVFLGVIYSGETNYLFTALGAALAFNLVASAVYVYNDMYDREKDRFHPKKRLRPLASNVISQHQAWVAIVVLLFLGLSLASFISLSLILILFLYLLINLAYNHGLKKIPVFDVCCIASGFLLRVLAGTVGIGLFISWWLTFAATLVSLLIVLSKRRLEKQLVLEHETRTVLKKYSVNMLNFSVIFSASCCFILYTAYIISMHASSICFLLTLPLSAIGLGRFVYLSLSESEQDDPILYCFKDPLSYCNLMVFSLLTLLACMT